MAIGLSLTPRGYNPDVTGKAYTLDPDPLLNAASMAFASQKENQRQMQTVALQGVALGEYIGARQQLGRVKAQLGDLDVNDPLFAQKYSSIVADNPLAFTNERIAPVTKAAVTPVLASASQAMENQAALQRAQVMAGYQQQQAQYRAGLQQQNYQYRVDNPLPRAPRQPGLGERLLFGDPTATPPAQTSPSAAPSQAAPQSSSAPAGGYYAPDLPVESSDAYGGGLIPFGPDGAYSDDPALLQPDGVVEGEGDGTAVVPPNIRNTPLGPMRVTSVGEGATLEPFVEAAPVQENIPGYMAVPDKVNPEDGTAATRKYVPIPGKSAAAIKEEQDTIDLIVGTDPEIAKLVGTASVLDAKHKGLVASADKMTPEQKELLAPQIAESMIEAAGAASVAKIATDQARLKLTAESNPKAAAAMARRDYDKALASIPIYGTGEGMDVTDSPAPLPAAAKVMPSAADQLKRPEGKANEAAWHTEKTAAVDEARRIESALGLTPGTFITAVAKDDKKSINAVLDEAARRGLKSPMLSFQPMQYGGGVRATFTTSPNLRRSYREILGAAAGDPNYNGFNGSTQVSPTGKRGGVRLVK